MSSSRETTITNNSDEENVPVEEEESERKDEQGRRIVTFEGKEDPKSWATTYKAWITFQLGMLALAASAGSSIISPADDTIAEYVGVSSEVSVLSVSLYILGFAFGPLVWAPVSEIWGRRWSMLPAMFCLAMFSIGTGFSTNAETVFITRFFGGLFGSAPVSNVSAALGDIYAPKARGIAVVFYAIAVVGGPSLSPVVGAALLVQFNWRWTEWAEAIFAFLAFLLALFCLPEVYSPVLLKKKAQRLRKETGDESYYHPHEDLKISFKELVTKHFSRTIKMLVTEPIVTSIAVYASFVYAILYLTLEVFPIVFIEGRGYSEVVGTLPFIALFVGVLAAAGLNLSNQKRYARLVDEAGGKPVPEGRLPPMMVGAVVFCGGLFWFGWTADKRYNVALPIVGAVLIGMGFNTIFQQCINILVDSYALSGFAASAVSANTFLRSILAAGLPMAAMPMFHNLGTPDAMSILGAVAGIAIPIPFIFARYGKQLRARSAFAKSKD